MNQAVLLREDLAAGARGLLTLPLITLLARLIARRLRAQARWFKQASTLDGFPENRRDLATIDTTLTLAHQHGMDVAGAELGRSAMTAAGLAAHFLSGVDSTTVGRLAGGSVVDAFGDIASRSKAIATTEIVRAFNAGGLVAAGQDSEKRVVPSGNACPTCLAAAREGWLPAGAPFVAGFSPPFHPNCMCGLTFRLVNNPVD